MILSDDGVTLSKRFSRGSVEGSEEAVGSCFTICLAWGVQKTILKVVRPTVRTSLFDGMHVSLISASAPSRYDGGNVITPSSSKIFPVGAERLEAAL